MRLGNLGSENRADVGNGGIIRLSYPAVQIEFWVGADDRWHIPATAITARQSLVGDAPVIRTSVRVPGGDATLVTYTIRQGRHDLLVTDVANESAVPFAIAIVVHAEEASLALDGAVLRCHGEAIVYLSGAPQLALSNVGVSPGAGVDASNEVLLAGLRGRRAHPSAELPAAFSEVALLMPVSHATTMRVVVALGPAPVAAAPPVFGALPSPEQVVRGWDGQRRGAAHFDLPDPALASKYRRLLCAALLQFDAKPENTVDQALLARTAAQVGWTDRAAAMLDGLEDRQGRKGAFANDLATTALCADALITADQVHLMPVIAAALEYVAKNAPSNSGWGYVLALAATWFPRHGETGAARAAAKAWSALGGPWPMPPWPRPAVPATSFGALFVPAEAAGLAADVESILGRLVVLAADGSADLLSGFEPDWRGGPVEIHGLPVGGGLLSAAVRWHGPRPALLWECTGHVVGLTCRRLDSEWSTTEPRGEVLLNP